MDILGRLLPRRRFRPLRPRREDGADVERLIERLNEIFSLAPDLPLQRSVRIQRLPSRAFRIAWISIDDGGQEGSTDYEPDTLRELGGDADVEKGARQHLLRQVRRRAMVAAGWKQGEPEPLWAHVASQPMVTLLQTMGLETATLGGDLMDQRLMRAVSYIGGRAVLTAVNGRVEGFLSLPKGVDTPECSYRSDTGILRVTGTTAPETMLAAMRGRNVDQVALIDRGMPGATILHAESGDLWLEMTVDAPLAPLADPPAGYDAGWIDHIPYEEAACTGS